MTSAVLDALNDFFLNSEDPILFAGAGVSVRAGLPTWQTLIKQLAESLRPYDRLMAQAMLEEVENNDLLLAAEYFYLNKKMLEGEKNTTLKRILSTSDVSAIRDLAHLPFPD